MFEFAVVKAYNKAIAQAENWNTDGVNWDFVDADMYMDCTPETSKQIDQFYHLFDDLADLHEKYYSGMSYTEYSDLVAKVEAEYKELFGITA